MPDLANRARIERLLRGDFRSDDLTRLFLFMRDRCDGRESVQEVGDFVAHHDERTKGLITRTTREFAAIVQGIAPTVQSKRTDYTRLPPMFREGMSAAISRLDEKRLRSCGLSRKEAQQLLPGFAKRFITNVDRTLSIPIMMTAKERGLLRAAFLITIRPAFDDSRLFADFVATTRSHGLLRHDEMREFVKLKSAVALFAVSVMHNCVVIGSDGTRIRLEARIAPDPGLEVMAHVPFDLGGRADVFVSSAIFSTDLPPETHCESELLRLPTPIECPLEVTPQLKLAPLR